MQTTSYNIDISGKVITAEFSDLVPKANGAVIMRSGETVVLVTAVMGEKPVSLPYFPLSVEYEEKFYAAGAILGSRFVRREGRPSDEAILAARIVDRTIRPLFSHTLRREVQVVVTVLAIGEEDPDVLGVLGASLALGVSDIPWQGPVGAVRLAQKNDSDVLIVNPRYTERVDGENHIELLACGTGNDINMIETAAREVPEATIVSLLTEATAIHRRLVAWQESIIAERGIAKQDVPSRAPSPELVSFFADTCAADLTAALFSGTTGKAHLATVKQAFLTSCATTLPDVSATDASDYFDTMLDEQLHRGVVMEGRRPDGRRLDEVRPLFAQAGGISPVLHGSGIFYRGETHIFSALTLGGPDAAQVVDTMEEREAKKRFMHHYNFPPFSVGEVGRVGGQNRRMVGHGALAEKALVPVIPALETFPYTIRLVSETLSSNGSSSMGSVCASSLALMDGGIPISRAVAGIASGVMFYDGQHQLLTDIQGPEDEYGDMDFKVAGTTVGVTAIQMDVKVSGVPVPILAEALAAARLARLTILATMDQAIAEPRAVISPRAPHIVTLTIRPDQIGLVIGGGGKTINGIKSDTGVDEISIEDNGTVFITGKGDSAEAAADRIRALTRRYEVGEVTTATITRLAPFGAFAALDTYNEGLIHISEIAPVRLETVEGLLTIGETVPVVVSKVEDGKIGLSIKRADPDFYARRTEGGTASSL
jgi:polyribonucleotide nucleotidyltransferase